VTALELFRALLGPKELDEPEEGVLFELPEKPAVSCVPCCDWCGMQGPPIPADLGIGKRYRFGETWGAMVSFGLLSINEHKRTTCERRGEHPEELARLLEDREAFAGTEDLDDEEDDDADLE
jgi:hypothetical protein